MSESTRKGGLLVYIKSFLPCNMLIKFKMTNNIQVMLFQLKLWKGKWLFLSIYKPQLQKYLVSILDDILDFNSNEYDNKGLVGVFNGETSGPRYLRPNVIFHRQPKYC